MSHSRTFLSAAVVAAFLITAGCGDSPESMLAKAREAVEKKDTKTAEIQLKALLQKQDNAEARFLLGRIYLNAGDFRSAEKELVRAVDGGYDKYPAKLALVETRFNLGEFAKALTMAEGLTPPTPADTAILKTLMGRIQLASGKRDLAQKAFTEALAANPEHHVAELGLIALMAVSDLKGASARIDAVLAKAPNLAEAMNLKGDLELLQQRPAQGKELYAKVASLEPLNRQVRAKLATITSEAKEYAEAQKWIDELKKLTGPAPGTMYLQALNDFRQGKNEPARDAIQAALKSAPEHLPSIALASAIYLSLNSYEQAELNARKVIEKAPGSPLGYRLLATTYLRLNSPDRALQTVSPLIDKGVKDPLLLGIAGEASLKLNEPEKAANYFAKAAALSPSDANQITGLGVARIAAGDRAAGLAELEKAAELKTGGNQADLTLITQLFKEKQWDKALAAIDRFEKKEPNSGLPPNLRGTVAMARGDAAGARKLFEAALAKDPKFFAAASNLATLDLREKKPDEAKKRFTDFLEKNPNSTVALLSVAQLIMAGSGDKAEALNWLKKARESDKSSVPATLALANYFVTNKQPKEALPILQEALSASPDRIELLDALGKAYLQAGDESLAVTTFEKILRARPDSSQLHVRMGEFYLSRKNPERAMEYFEKAVKLAPTAIEPRAAIASLLIASGKIGEARAIAAALQKEAPKSASGALLEADINAFDKKYPEAIVGYRKALAIEPSVPVSLKLVRVLNSAGKTAEADTLLDSIVAANPNDLGVKHFRGLHEVGRKRWAKVAEIYKDLYAIQPDHPATLNNLAWALHSLNDPAALTYAEKAMLLSGRLPEVLDTYGTILLARGKNAEAVKAFKDAVAGAPDTPGFRVSLAEALIADGSKSDARRELELVMSQTKDPAIIERAKGLMQKL